MNRKIIAIFAALLISASLCACGGNGGGEESTTTNKIDIGTEVGSENNGNNNSSNQSEEATTEDVNKEVTFTEKNDVVYVIHSSNQVNLRSDPNMKESSAKKVVTNGTELQRIAISDDGDWSKVIYEGVEYYIGTSCITTLKDLDEGFVEVSKELTLKVDSLFVRIAPSKTNEAVDTIYAGDKIQVIAENTTTGWYKIKFNGKYAQEGYVAADAEFFE